MHWNTRSKERKRPGLIRCPRAIHEEESRQKKDVLAPTDIESVCVCQNCASSKDFSYSVPALKLYSSCTCPWWIVSRHPSHA